MVKFQRKPFVDPAKVAADAAAMAHLQNSLKPINPRVLRARNILVGVALSGLAVYTCTHIDCLIVLDWFSVQKFKPEGFEDAKPSSMLQ